MRLLISSMLLLFMIVQPIILCAHVTSQSKYQFIESTDSTKGDFYLEQLQKNKFSQADQKIAVGEKFLQYAKLSEQLHYEAQACFLLGEIYYEQWQPVLAKEYFQQATLLYMAQKDTIGQALSNIYLGVLSQDLEEMMRFYNLALKELQMIGAFQKLAQSYTLIAEEFLLEGYRSKALEYFNLAEITYTTHGDLESALLPAYRRTQLLGATQPEAALGDLLRLFNQSTQTSNKQVSIKIGNAITSIYIELNYLQKAKYFSEKVIESSTPDSLTQELMNTYLLSGKIYDQLNRKESAASYFQQAYKIATHLQHLNGLKKTTIALATLQLEQSDIQMATILLQTTLQQINDTYNTSNNSELELLLAKCYEQKGKTEEASKYYQNIVKQKRNTKGHVWQSANLGLANYYLQNGQFKKSEDLLEKDIPETTIQAEPNNESVKHFLFYQLYKEQKKTDLALVHLEQYHQQLAIEQAAKEFQMNQQQQIIRKFTFDELKADLVLQKEKQLASVYQQQQIQKYIWIFGTFVLGGLLLGLFWWKHLQYENVRKQFQTQKDLQQYIEMILDRDLRNPILSFRGVAQKVMHLINKEDYATLSLLSFDVERYAFQLHKLTDNLLTWLLLESDKISFQPKEIPLTPVLKNILPYFERLAQDKNIYFHTKLFDDAYVFADPQMLKIILTNLLENALNVTNAEGFVELKVVEEDTGICIQISDSGQGLPITDQTFLFRPDKKEGDLKPGAGMGLYLVHQLTKINKGNLDYFSLPEKGTTFSLILPEMEGNNVSEEIGMPISDIG